jgi:hypothetical protein
MIFSAINSFIQAGKQNKMAKKINPVNTTYDVNPAISNLYSEGKNLYQGRMAGAGEAQQGLLTNAANFGAGVDSSATSGSQAIAAKAGAFGQTQQGFTDLAITESQDKQRRFGIYSNVSQLMTQEGDKVYQDKLRKYYDDLNYKRALEGAAMQNKASAWQGLDDTVMAAANLFAPGVGLLAGKKPGVTGTSLSGTTTAGGR